MDQAQTPEITWKEIRRRFCGGEWWPTDGQFYLFDPGRIPLPLPRREEPDTVDRHERWTTAHPAGTCGEPGAQ
jgi:hypothetical protein